MNKERKVLIIPLDWGLGHATRCIPIIHYMISKGWSVTLAGEGKVAQLLAEEFPTLEVLPLKGYRISYPAKGWLFVPKIILQIPKIIGAIAYENRWLKKNIALHTWDLVISDNRYGLFTNDAKTIIITHQLSVITGIGNFADTVARKIIYRFINRYNACWVPDTEDQNNIADRLSHPKDLPEHVQYIGPLSRLSKKNISEENFILILLSGPEPQRTLLENILIEQASKIDEQFLCVRGLPSSHQKMEDKKNIRFENHLPAEELSTLLARAKMVICRTGYSTVMDLLKLQKKAIMIPTPGQTEQEFLGKRLGALHWYLIQDQQHIDLAEGIPQCLQYTPSIPQLDFEEYSRAIDAFSIQYFGA
jgi:uncharacterized protein (TIGR00661 family)